MLQTLLASTKAILINKYNMDQGSATEVINFLVNFKKGHWLYPGVLIRKFKLSITQTYELLEVMRNEGLLERYYELHCGKCQKSTGDVYKVLNEMPDTFYCESCDKEYPALENSVMIYKVLKDA